ncbi:unnamed protein product [Schistosoma margrebowiei]|uniref:Uncharacterized protein n=1 Tax=Schistosoma margrebowiei TaxID=48269 RepID=A0A3P8CR89_9TREM|nr:unnamed protein product [Schistosoma margrebowiei]
MQRLRLVFLDLTGWVRWESGPISILNCSYVFYESLIRSIIHCSLIVGIITLYINRAHRSQIIQEMTITFCDRKIQ